MEFSGKPPALLLMLLQDSQGLLDLLSRSIGNGNFRRGAIRCFNTQHLVQFTTVEHAGDDVLVLRPAILDLDVVAPETSPNSRSAIPSAGQMTLYMELIDSASGDMLAKVLDHRFDRTRVNTHLRNRVRNERAARAMLGDWATMLRQGLDEAHMAARGESAE